MGFRGGLRFGFGFESSVGSWADLVKVQSLRPGFPRNTQGSREGGVGVCYLFVQATVH